MTCFVSEQKETFFCAVKAINSSFACDAVGI